MKIMRNFFLMILLFIKYIPFDLMIKIRTFCYSYLMKSFGSGSICDGVTILNPSSMQIGNRVSIADINDDASPDTIKSWDSLKHMNLIIALEEEFSLELSEEDIVEMINYKLIINILS
jgi:acyl carrier protein